MYAASTRTMAGPFHQAPYKLQDVSGASEVSATSVTTTTTTTTTTIISLYTRFTSEGIIFFYWRFIQSWVDSYLHGPCRYMG